MGAQKHVLIYSDDPGRGGVAMYNHSIAKALARAGRRVTMAESRNDTPLVAERAALGIGTEWIEYDTIDGFGRTLTDRETPQRILGAAKPDAVIFSDCCPLSNLAAKQVAREFGIPYVSVIGFAAGYLAEKFSFLLPLLRETFAAASEVVAVSGENLALLRQRFMLPPDRGRVIHYGRPAASFSEPDLERRRRLRAGIGVAEDQVLCFTAARLEPVKGYPYQLAAMERLRQSPVWPRLRFAWAGTGGLETELRTTIGDLGLADKVSLLGQCWDVAEWLDAADIFVLPSEAEGMPLAIMEAMAKGVPVAATSISGVPEELGDTGMLLGDPRHSAGDVVARLAAAIEGWAADRETRLEAGRRCRDRARRLFTEERMADETLSVVDAALRGERAAAAPANSAGEAELPVGDYTSPGLVRVRPDHAFPFMRAGDKQNCQWQYLRREVPHNWYVDGRVPAVGFLSRDEAAILHNSALQFRGKRALEIGCFLGWSACHLALAGVRLDTIDPLLGRADFRGSVEASLGAAGVLGSVRLVAGGSPDIVPAVAGLAPERYSLIFIDGNSDGPAPLQDAVACEPFAAEDAMVLFHDLAAPDVAAGLDYYRCRGWNTRIYHTMQIIGVAWRGRATPVDHTPDPAIHWPLPAHLARYETCQAVAAAE